MRKTKRILLVGAMLVLASLACERVTPTPDSTLAAPVASETVEVAMTETPRATATPVVILVHQTSIVTVAVEITKLIFIPVTVTFTPSPTGTEVPK